VHQLFVTTQHVEGLGVTEQSGLHRKGGVSLADAGVPGRDDVFGEVIHRFGPGQMPRLEEDLIRSLDPRGLITSFLTVGRRRT
jgi:hypothetical protein